MMNQRMTFRAQFTLWLVTATCIAGALGCSAMTGFFTLAPDEKVHYERVADCMSLEQRTAYLEIADHAGREAYLKSLGLDRETFENNPQAHTHGTAHDPNTVAASGESPSMFDAIWGKKKPAATEPQKPVQPPIPQSPLVQSNDTLLGAAMAPKAEVTAAAPPAVAPPQSVAAPVAVAAAPVAPAPPAQPLISPVIPSPGVPPVTAAPVTSPAPVAPAAVAAAPVPAIAPVAETVNKPPAVDYTRTGDPVSDVLTLLELYEGGKISKAQFEQEKEIALNKSGR